MYVQIFIYALVFYQILEMWRNLITGFVVQVQAGRNKRKFNTTSKEKEIKYVYLCVSYELLYSTFSDWIEEHENGGEGRYNIVVILNNN